MEDVLYFLNKKIEENNNIKKIEPSLRLVIEKENEVYYRIIHFIRENKKETKSKDEPWLSEEHSEWLHKMGF